MLHWKLIEQQSKDNSVTSIMPEFIFRQTSKNLTQVRKPAGKDTMGNVALPFFYNSFGVSIFDNNLLSTSQFAILIFIAFKTFA
jgi:hypothetical protein